LHAQHRGVVGCEHNYLALSGGGANGAFGAGLLTGWTRAGTRPEFTFVTGISTGALSAPFAYLGADWDQQLEQVYTSFSTKDLVKKTPLAAVTSSAVFSTKGLQGMIARFFDETVMEAVAAEFRDKGRQLSIGTTNLDTLRPVNWNITRIAASGHPDSLELIRKVMLASASIPIAFPPVQIEVEVDGQNYDELHVDGGAAAQIFLYPAGIDWARVLERLEVQGRPNVYLIRNSCYTPDWKEMKPLLLPIALRTVKSLIRTQGIGDMFRVYLAAQRDGLDFHLADIPKDFETQPAEQFDPAYMRQLFDLGHGLAESGYPWKRTPYEL
jgi:predicted patatin/cPLA2 family phospholipase